MLTKKIVIGIAIAISISIIVILIPISSNETNLSLLSEDNSKRVFISQFDKVLNQCSSATGLALSNCKMLIGSLQSKCPLFHVPSVCNDSRINGTINTKSVGLIIQNSTNFTTYSSSKFGFSINYPSNWISSEYPPYWNETLIVNFTDNQNSPNALILIKESHNTNDSFQNVVSKYMNGTGVSGYPINIQSKDKVMIGNKEANKIQYSQSIGSVTCKYEDFVINTGEFVPIISFSNCDEDSFEQFLPTYETIVTTFKKTW